MAELPLGEREPSPVVPALQGGLSGRAHRVAIDVGEGSLFDRPGRSYRLLIDRASPPRVLSCPEDKPGAVLSPLDLAILGRSAARRPVDGRDRRLPTALPSLYNLVAVPTSSGEAFPVIG